MYEITDRLSVWMLMVISLASLIICVVSWVRRKDFVALCYVLPVAYLCAYFITQVFSPSLYMVRIIFLQAGILFLLLVNVVWRGLSLWHHE